MELRHKVCKARQVFAPTRGVGSGSREGECAKEGPGELVRVSLGYCVRFAARSILFFFGLTPEKFDVLRRQATRRVEEANV